jgi:fluoride exporter
MTESTDPHPEVPLDPDTPSTGEGPALASHLSLLSLGLVFAGGVAGTAIRYSVSLALPTHTGRWPTGTFVVNMSGALILGVLLEALARRGPDSGWRRRTRLLFGAGFCGSLTTYSTLATESDLLIRSHDGGLAIAYAVTSVLGGLALTAIGIAIAGAHHRTRVQRSAS